MYKYEQDKQVAKEGVLVAAWAVAKVILLPLTTCALP
jgi:hypothetical protein